MTAHTPDHLTRRLLRCSLALGVALACLAPALTGCQRVKRPYQATGEPYARNQIQLADKELEGRLAFDPPSVSRDDSDLLYVTIPARAATNRPQIVQYRLRFLDQNGRPLPGGEYRTVTLESNTTSFLTGNSTSPRADDFQVEIRLAR